MKLVILLVVACLVNLLPLLYTIEALEKNPDEVSVCFAY